MPGRLLLPVIKLLFLWNDVMARRTARPCAETHIGGRIARQRRLRTDRGYGQHHRPGRRGYEAPRESSRPHNPTSGNRQFFTRRHPRTDFNYVVKKQDQRKICFGSGCPRDTSSRAGMNSFMRYYAREEFPDVGPGRYNVSEAFKFVKEKPCTGSISTKGYSGLARFGSRISHVEDLPAPGDYVISTFPSKVKTLKYAFASTAKRKSASENKNPGPGMYKNIDPVKRRILYEHSFGGKVRMKLGVEIKCCKRNNDTCESCGKKPIGDYWHLNNRIFLCRPCMLEERRKLSNHTNLELQGFRKLRDCSEIHMHDGTDAKIWLMHPGEIEKWTRQEAYLCAYFKD